MRVGLVTPSWPPGAQSHGVVTYCSRLRAGIEAAGASVTILAHEFLGDRPAGSVLIAREDRKLLQRLLYKIDTRRGVVRSIANALTRAFCEARERYGVDIFEIEESRGSCGIATRRTGLPVVTRLHGPWIMTGVGSGLAGTKDYAYRIKCEGRAFACASAISSPSHHALERVRSHYRLSLPDAVVIPNPQPACSADQRWRLADCDPNLLLFVGRFDRVKGADIVLKAFAVLLRQRPALRLCFVGPDHALIDDDGGRWDCPSFLEELFPTAETRAQVEYLGAQPAQEVASLRKKCYLTIVASRSENFPYTATEALACGTPLVASDAGGLPELVRDGRNGLLFRSGDPADLAKKVAILMDQPDLAQRFSEQGRQDCETLAPASIGKRMLEFYERTLATVGAAG